MQGDEHIVITSACREKRYCRKSNSRTVSSCANWLNSLRDPANKAAESSPGSNPPNSDIFTCGPFTAIDTQKKNSVENEKIEPYNPAQMKYEGL